MPAAEMLALTKRLLEAADGGRPVLLASLLEAGPDATLVQGARLLVEQDGTTLGSLGNEALDALVVDYAPGAFEEHSASTVYVDGDHLNMRVVSGATSIYVEVVEAKPTFLVVGAGHVGRSLVKLADFLDFHVVVIDDRDDFADPELLPEADQVICADFEEALENFPITNDTSIVLVTRGHKQDEVSLRKCLGRGARYLGMIGSRRRSATVLEHLIEEGFEREEIAKVRTPIGLDIHAESPEEIAIAVMAEVIMLRKGGEGAPMYYRKAALRNLAGE
ncbi:MAG: XdhC/CoxI family protein [Dehalococcoidia bacterium]|nr:XdhC family protein [Dehalococcoidia bacterium]